ncbi:site-specific integrase [Paraflavitalea pollutisoli]|uniref:site-specific integrase n=1 Tax=Paraflavitalea pollutisoli TaxID=3034143 RepID=UPI0023EAC905|nr:site-specific integrase [Paraflavitalea sp. H1-2-19X]
MNIAERPNRSNTKIFYYEEWGRGKGDRASLNIFTYIHPKNQLEKKHNEETLKQLAVKKAESILDQQAVGTGYIPTHRFKENFLDYYEEYVKKQTRKGNRHLKCGLTQFKLFLGKDFLTPIEMTEELSTGFRNYLLEKYTGDTPANYFSKFKKMIRAASKDGYFRINPSEDVKAKSNPSIKVKDNLEVEDYLKLLETRCSNIEVKEAFLLSCYAGLRWCDVNPLEWDKDIQGDQLRTRLLQAKTKQPVWITLHPVAKAILEKRKAAYAPGLSSTLVFRLPNHYKAGTILQRWCDDAGIHKHITWHCARLSFSILLQDKNTDNATVAALMGLTSPKYVDRVYKRHRPKDQTAVINKLPHPVQNTCHTSLVELKTLQPGKVTGYAEQVPIMELLPSKSKNKYQSKSTG